MSVAEELTFHLEDFDGPLELLLALVAKHKMDLHNIPILELIDQYTATVARADPDPEAASAFIEMAARLVEMKSYLLLPRSEEGERMKQEFTGQLIEYDQCRRMAALLRQKAEAAPVFVRPPMEMEFDNTYDLHHAPQVLADYWAVLSGRTKLRREPTQQQFEPLVTAPMVSVTSRVVYILRHLIAGTAAKMSQLFSRQQTRSTNVATFLALLELVRGGRVKLDDEGWLTMQRGRIQRDKEKERTRNRSVQPWKPCCLPAATPLVPTSWPRRCSCRSSAWKPRWKPCGSATPGRTAACACCT